MSLYADALELLLMALKDVAGVRHVLLDICVAIEGERREVQDGSTKELLPRGYDHRA